MTVKVGVFVFTQMLKNKDYQEILLIVEFIWGSLINYISYMSNCISLKIMQDFCLFVVNFRVIVLITHLLRVGALFRLLSSS